MNKIGKLDNPDEVKMWFDVVMKLIEQDGNNAILESTYESADAVIMNYRIRHKECISNV